MSVVTVQRRSRTEVRARHLRQKGILPMALIQKSHETALLQAPEELLKSAIRNADGLGRVSLQFEDEKRPRKAIIKSIDVDPLKHRMLHITLQEVSEDDVVTVDIPVVALGEPKAMELGDYLFMAVTDHVKVKGKLSKLPEKLEVDVTDLQPSHHIEASSLTLPKDVELVSSPDSTLFSLRPSLLATAEPAAEEEAEATSAAPDESSEA